MAQTKEGRWYRVCLNTIVRKGVELESERLRILPMGSRVRIIRQEARRVEIDQPIKGWCSLKSSNGDTILTPLDQQEINVPTPKGNVKKKWDKKTKNYEKESQKYATTEKQKAELLGDANAKNLYDLTKELKLLKEQVQQKQLTEQERKKNESELHKTSQAIESLKDSTKQKQQEIEDLQAKISDLQVDDDTKKKVAEIQRLEEEKMAADKKLAVAKRLAEAAKREMDEMQSQFKEMFAKDKDDKDDEYEAGDVLMVKEGLGVVVVKFYGKVDGMKDEKFLGVELSDPIGDTNGTVNGKKYFEVHDDHGLFIRKDQVKKKILPEQLLKQLHATLRTVQRSKNAKE